MRVTRLFHPGELQCGETVTLDSENSSHLIRVLRTRTGSTVVIFNGDGYDYQCTTLDENAKKTSLSIDEKNAVNNESRLNITLIQGLSRQDRMEATIQKSIELGANRIVPVICQRSNAKLPAEKKDKKLKHWRKVAISACGQSGRCIIPQITDVITLSDIHEVSSDNAVKLVLDPEAGISLKDIKITEQACEIEIFIGPEGGLSQQELDLLIQHHFCAIRFGPRILRTETAGPAVISALQTLWGDL